MSRLLGMILCSCLVWSSWSQGANAPNLRGAILDLNGRSHDLDQNEFRRLRVLVFLSTECPISNAYTATLNRLQEQFANKAARIELFGVVSDSTTTRLAASKHFAEFKADFPILFDGSGWLARQLKPTHVPEAFVLDDLGCIVYCGAIDNTWVELGRRRPKPDRHFLLDAITSALAHEPSAVKATTPVGCLVEKLAERPVSYTRDIAPIMQARCVTCHRDGQAAPFSLMTYEQTAKRAKQLVRVTQAKLMPPWIPADGHEKFVGERWLTDRELSLLREWAEKGVRRGEDADFPVTPKFADGWQLGEPDLILKMTDEFTIPADGPDILQNFVIPIPIPEDKMVAAVEFHPGNKRVCHHSVLFLDASGKARTLDQATPELGYSNANGTGFLPSGALGGWSVGNTPRYLPNGMGRYLKKGSDLVMQMHYHPTGRIEKDRSEVGLYFLKKPVTESLKEAAKLVGSIWMANYEMDIPAGEKNYRRSTTYRLPKDVLMVGVVPHMHLLGKSMKVTARLPDDTVKTIIDVKHWNYRWQDEYYFERPLRLPAGTQIDVEAAFDNSSDNTLNPSSPPKRVTWGEGTNDEMMYCFFLLTADKTEDLIKVIFDNLAHDAKQPRREVSKEPAVSSRRGE